MSKRLVKRKTDKKLFGVAGRAANEAPLANGNEPVTIATGEHGL